MTGRCDWGDCDNPAPWRETVSNSETGERKTANLCLIHWELVWQFDQQQFRRRYKFDNECETIDMTWTCGVCGEEWQEETIDPPLGESTESTITCPSCGDVSTVKVTTVKAPEGRST